VEQNRVKAVIEYDGSKFKGFQIQKGEITTVVSSIESALKSLGIDSKVIGSGRTDSGVHATGQVIHFDIPTYWKKKTLNELKSRLNQKLTYIRFKYLKLVDNSFHAQYSAKVRVYRYLIKRTPLKVFERDFITYRELNNLKLIKEGLKLFEGQHDFGYFKKEGSFTSSDIRTIYRTKVAEVGSYVAIYTFANGYLRSQIRLIVESLFALDRGDISLKELKEQIDKKRRYITKPSPPNGLYLNRVIY